MGSKTTYLSQKVLDHCLGGSIFTPPATIYFLLSAGGYDPTATGSACNELLSTGGYARISAPNNSATWALATANLPSVKTNSIDIAWAVASAAWDSIPESIYIADAATGGNLLYGADLANPVAVSQGDTFKVLAGAFVFNED